MVSVQFIQLRGRVVAAVAGGRAGIAVDVEDSERLIVHGMSVYALEIDAGERPGPYRDDDALRYAERLIAATRGCPARGRRERRR